MLRVPPYNPGVDPGWVVSPELATAAGLTVAAGTVDVVDDGGGTLTDSVNGFAPVVLVGVRSTRVGFARGREVVVPDREAAAPLFEGIATSAITTTNATATSAMPCRPPTVFHHGFGPSRAARPPPGGPDGGPIREGGVIGARDPTSAARVRRELQRDVDRVADSHRPVRDRHVERVHLAIRSAVGPARTRARVLEAVVLGAVRHGRGQRHGDALNREAAPTSRKRGHRPPRDTDR